MSLFHRVATVLGMAAIGGLAVSASASDAPRVQQTDGISIQADELSDNFTVSVSNAKAKVGEKGTITVTVKASGGFKCNPKYPHKIKDISGSNVDAPSKVSGAVNGKSISYSIPATPTAAGSHAVTGEIRFSVCNDQECQMKKVPLSATVTGT